MRLKFFIDQCVPTSIKQILQDGGYEVEILREHIPIDSPDQVVIAKAQELGAVLVSLNGDFADIVTYPPANYRGIVSIQLKNHPEIISLLMKRLLNYFSTHERMGHYQGKLLIVEVNRIRIRE